MADRAEVVPLRRRGAPAAPEPADYFPDAADPDRSLSVTWSPDGQEVALVIGTTDGAAGALLLDADDVLDLVRVLVGGLPETGAGGPRPSAKVLSLKPRLSHLTTRDS